MRYLCSYPRAWTRVVCPMALVPRSGRPWPRPISDAATSSLKTCNGGSLTQFACNLCALAPKAHGDKFVLGTGNVKADIVILGDAPSQYDARTGVPMSSHDERALNGDVDLLVKLCKEAGIPGNAIFRTTLIKCRTGIDRYKNSETIKPEEIQACHGHLDRELSFIKPKIIIALGAPVVERLLDKSVAAGQDRVFDSA